MPSTARTPPEREEVSRGLTDEPTLTELTIPGHVGLSDPFSWESLDNHALNCWPTQAVRGGDGP